MNTKPSNDLIRGICGNAHKRPSPSSSLPLKSSSSSYHDDHSCLHRSRGLSNPHPCASSSAITPTTTKKQRLVSADDETTTKGADVDVGADADAVEAATALAAIGMARRPPVPMTYSHSQAQVPSESLQRESLENNRWPCGTTSTIHNAPVPLPPYSSHHQQNHPIAGSNGTVSLHVTNSFNERQKEQIVMSMNTTLVVPPSSSKNAHQRKGVVLASCTGTFTNRGPFSSMSNNAPFGGIPPPPRHHSFLFLTASSATSTASSSSPITPQPQQEEQARREGCQLLTRAQGSASRSVQAHRAAAKETTMCLTRLPRAAGHPAAPGGGISVRRGGVPREHQDPIPAEPLPTMIVNDRSTQATQHAEQRDDNSIQADNFVANVRAQRQVVVAFGGAVRDHDDGTNLSLVQSSSQSRQLRWFPGHTSLALPGDDDVLSPLHCFMRRYCVETFSATADDVCQPRYGKSHGNRVSIGQVGIRCLHCRSRPAQERADRAVCYPSTIKNIYHSMETWQRRHSALCQDIPAWVREKMMDLVMASRSGAGGRRQYWVDAAVRFGLVDTPDGVRFGRDPFSDEFRPRHYDGALEGVAGCGENPSHCLLREEGSSSGPASATVATTTTESSSRIVSPDDKSLVNEHIYLLMEQMEPCRFSEADRTGGRSKVKDLYLGYPGLQCRHCQGKAGLGRYFPSSVANLTLANSDRNIYNHMMKCRKCPAEVKSALNSLQRSNAEEGGKSKRGSRKIFFTRIWTKLHPAGGGLI